MLHQHKVITLSKVAGVAGTGEHKQHNLIAVCDVLSSILTVEHKAVQPHLLNIWQLLWQAAAGQQLSYVCMLQAPAVLLVLYNSPS